MYLPCRKILASINVRALGAIFLVYTTTYVRADTNGHFPHITTSFYSRPDIKAPLLTIHVNDERSSPGYIFTNPQSPFYQSGPNIYDHNGELVWAGAADGLASNAYGFHACDYAGSRGRHLCFFQGVQMFGEAYGYGMILNDQYKVVKTVQSQGGMDIHEFRLVNDGRHALVTKYGTRPFDFAGMSNPQGLRVIAEGVFEEIDLESDEVLFRWHSLDHIKPTTAVRGIEFENGQSAVYDYFHINGVDKNRDGDYLISARHTSAVYKISGVDGHVIWTLSNGPESDFQLDGFVIWGAHHARWRSENGSHTIFTLFNNGWDGDVAGTDHSSGLAIAIDHESRRARVTREYGAGEKLGAVSKGSMQTLPGTGNVLLGWGSEPHMTEYLEDGTLVFHATVAGGGDTYRVFKQDWAGRPSSRPTLWTYARTRDPSSRTAFYVSWNGATAVASWNFYVGDDDEGDDDKPREFALAGSEDVSGFETVFSLPRYCRRAFAEAVAADGTSLGNSSVVSPWTPEGPLAAECDEWRCPEREAEFRVTFNLLPDLDSGKGGSFRGKTESAVHDVRTGHLSWIPPPSLAFLSVESTVVMAAVIVTCSILAITLLCGTCGRRKSWINEKV